MDIKISVVICTHNPRKNYLEKVLSSLRSQSLKIDNWELLLVDNVSNKVLSSEFNLSWHPYARHIREESLGLTHARLRGIKESIGDVIVFVDDDNVLALNYLENTLYISENYAFLGSWGGQIHPEFEEPPPEWTKPYWGMLAIREFSQDKWSNLPNHYETAPCGAGLCVRRFVAEKYVDLLRENPKRSQLDRSGNLLTSCGDSDLAFTACDVGLGTGIFTSLELIHLIPASRLQENYLLQLNKGLDYSATILNSLRGKVPAQVCRSQKLLKYYERWRMDARSRRFYDASEAGKALALQEISN
jgi:hypothetical protein